MVEKYICRIINQHQRHTGLQHLSTWDKITQRNDNHLESFTSLLHRPFSPLYTYTPYTSPLCSLCYQSYDLELLYPALCLLSYFLLCLCALSALCWLLSLLFPAPYPPPAGTLWPDMSPPPEGCWGLWWKLMTVREDGDQPPPPPPLADRDRPSAAGRPVAVETAAERVTKGDGLPPTTWLISLVKALSPDELRQVQVAALGQSLSSSSAPSTGGPSEQLDMLVNWTLCVAGGPRTSSGSVHRLSASAPVHHQVTGCPHDWVLETLAELAV